MKRVVLLIVCITLAAVGETVRAQNVALRPSSAQSCTVCHLKWMEAFNRPNANTLIPEPAHPVVAEEDSCLGCHDGSVGDSRRSVWLDHGHQTDVTPPDDMTVPDVLPLDEGRIACRTCHTAHGGGPETLANTVFIRVENDKAQLCTMCHTDQVGTAEQGTHPMVNTDWALPEKLAHAGAFSGPDGRQMTCRSCHTPHGSKFDHLLVLGTNSNQLCIACHEQISPAMWTPEMLSRHHGLQKLTDPAHQAAIEQLGTRTGADGAMICLTCHTMHDAPTSRQLLASDNDDSQLCIACHREQKSVLSTTHDLRTSAKTEKNLLGMTPDVGGPCSACHGAHGTARQPIVAPGDPTGTCTTCHSESQCAASAGFRTHDHPHVLHNNDLPAQLDIALLPYPDDRNKRILACRNCHNPHDAGHAHYLSAPPDRLCATCHIEQSRSLIGAHDFRGNPARKNAAGLTAVQTGKCGFCHAVHDASGPALWNATASKPQGPEQLCLACHGQDAGDPELVVGQTRHPMGPPTAEKAGKLKTSMPLFDKYAHHVETGFVSCSSCHNVHGNSTATHALMRPGAAWHATGACVTCHSDVNHAATSLHEERFIREFLEKAGIDASAAFCMPCHTVHAPHGHDMKGMWAAPSGAPSEREDFRQCTGCHQPQGGFAANVTPFEHPPAIMQNSSEPGTPGFLPLIDKHGRIGVEGQITCRTCHPPHGRELSASTVRALADGLLSDVELRSQSPMVRPYVVPNFCSSCHGLDGLYLYLYYHHPDKHHQLKLAQ